MSFTSLANADNASLPPRDVTTDPDEAWQSAASGLGAASADLWGTYVGQDGKTGAPAGKVWVELEAVTFDVYVRFSRSATTATSSSNGSVVKAGAPAVKFFVEPNVKDKFIDYISPGGVGVLKWRVCGPIQERYRA